MRSIIFSNVSHGTRSISARLFGSRGQQQDLDLKTFQLITAASRGDLIEVRRLVETEGVSVNAADYDKRTPLHLAAEEGHLPVVEYLLKNGADVDASDRWDATPVVSAVAGGKKDVVAALSQSRSQAQNNPHSVRLLNEMFTAVSDNNIELMERIFLSGLDVNSADSEGRTALHIAATKGRVEATVWLITKGANVNTIDVEGNNPLHDSEAGFDSKEKREIAMLLRKAGAVSEKDILATHATEDFKMAIVQSLPFLCERGGWQYVEIWTPNHSGTELLPFHEWYSPNQYANYYSKHTLEDVSFPSDAGLVGQAFTTRSVVSLSQFDAKKLLHHQKVVEALGIKSGIAVPLILNEKVFAVAVLFSTEWRDQSPEDLNAFAQYANGLVTSGFAKSTGVAFEGMDELSAEKMRHIYQIIASQGVFNSKHVYEEVYWFYRLGIPSRYYKLFDAHQIADHIHSFMAAKKVALALGTPEEIFVRKASSEHMFFMVPATYAHSLQVEREIEEVISKIPKGYAFSLTYFMSKNTFIPNGSSQLSLYIIEISPYLHTDVDHDESSIFKVASSLFLRDISYEIRTRYQEIINNAVGHMGASIMQHDRSKLDGTYPVTITFRHQQTASFLMKFTEVLKFHKLVCTRKYVETFSNGLVTYTFMLKSEKPEDVEKFARDAQLLSLVPGVAMRTLFLEGRLSVPQYVYGSSVRHFIYYFLNQKNHELERLSQALSGDNLNQGRLRNLASRLRREAVSAPRITQCLFEEVELVKLLFDDFERVCREGPSLNTALAEKIKKTADSVINAQILTALLTFNSNLLKTNFYTANKAALSFSLKANFFEDASYPENPYVIFFVLSQEFQGFHIRFRDISRGGIRVIKSVDEKAYRKNYEGQLSENYDLALTQNKKNKDIPEFGSKGTVLLKPNFQGSVKLAFQKYISGLLDLLVIDNPDVVDHYKQTEILFLGPDENTADVMEWAARYAKTRNYTYWKAFTTGKPPTLGGIPHDTYGMTTNSVHQYVLGCLEKLGLKEEEITKFQTGGPDGDLGSNEILFSKDKTTAIVDGSGVIYDPKGLDREELTRLARARKMVSHFDQSKLSKGGFFVNVQDKDVVLPHGEKVENGLAFRNEFHFHPLAKADLFVPCGGRPKSVSLDTVNLFIDENTGTPKYKIIIEGANLFITQEARVVLEEAGVILYRDASANKGGVTSSSFEVMAAISMTDEEHEEHMCVKDPANPPEFYKAYVRAIQESISSNARKEFECIWKEHERSGEPRCLLTDKVSDKINQLNDATQSSALFDNLQLREKVFQRAIPKPLQELVPISTLMNRLPVNYQQALFAAWLASNFVYKYGLHAHDFAFFEFVKELLE